jgi:uncharacterized membrane protein YsdA (DUF1294 family)
MQRARALLAATTMAGVLTWFWWRMGLDPLLAWLAAMTLMTFLAYAYDKWAACVGRGRVAEVDLLVLTLMGGTLGAALAMRLVRHKTSKLPFRRRFGLVMCLQALLAALWLFRGRLWPDLGF